MRTRAAAIAALLSLTLLAACGGDDEDTAATGDTTEEGTAEDGSEEEGGTDPAEDDIPEDGAVADSDVALHEAQLEVEDLGAGWELTDTKPAGEDDDEPSPLDACIPGDLDDRFDAAKVAETEERTFVQQGEGPIPAQLVSSSVALDGAALFEEMHEVLRSAEFADCAGDAFQEAMGGPDGSAEATMGDIEQEDAVVDPGDDPDLTSTGITFPVSISSGELRAEMTVVMAFINTGRVGSSMLVISERDERLPMRVAEWGGILAERLSAAR